MKWPNKLDQMEEWMNKLRSEVTKLTPWEIIKNETPNQPIKKLIKFPEQPQKREQARSNSASGKENKNKADKYGAKN